MGGDEFKLVGGTSFNQVLPMGGSFQLPAEPANPYPTVASPTDSVTLRYGLAPQGNDPFAGVDTRLLTLTAATSAMGIDQSAMTIENGPLSPGVMTGLIQGAPLEV